MRISIVLLISAGVLLFTVPAIANSDNKTSIALITDKASDLDKSPLVSLLEVELSQKEGIQLLERAAIDKILEEQQLNAAGLLDRNATIKIGKLLRADAFIILSLENQAKDANDLIRLRVSQTAHGLRLLDYFEQSNSTNPKEAVERIIKKLGVVLKKINQPEDKLIPIGIVDIHRVQLGEQYKMLERTLPLMLSVRLSLEPQIIMLEREDLKVLLDEKLRTEGEDSKFWNSAILIEGYLQPNSGQLEMHLNLKQTGGDNIKSLTVQIEPNEPATAIAKATSEIIQQLQNSPPVTKWQPELEAEQFYKQGQMLESHARYDEAVNLFEAAHALQPQNVYYTGTVFNLIWKKHKEIEAIESENEEIRQAISKSKDTKTKESLLKRLVEPPVCPYTNLEITEMVSVFVRQIRNGYEKGKLSADDIFHKWSQDIGLDIGTTEESFFSSTLSVTTEQIRQINRENRKIWVETFGDALKNQLITRNNPTFNNLIRARLTWISSDDPNELLNNLKASFTKFVMPPESGGEIRSESERVELYQKAFIMYNNFVLAPENLNRYTQLRGSGEEFAQLWKKFLEEVSTNIDPFASIGGQDYYFKDFQSTLDNIRIKLRSSDQHVSRYASDTILRLFSNSVSQLATSKITIDEVMDIWEEFCGYLIDENDINNLRLIFTSGSSTSILNMIDTKIMRGSSSNNKTIPESEIRNESYKRYYLLLKRVYGVLQSSKNDNDVQKALKNIRGIQAEIESKFPAFAVRAEKIFTVTMLLTQKDWIKDIGSTDTKQLFAIRWLQIKIQDEMLWIAIGLHNGHNYNIQRQDNIGLVGINLKQKKLYALWQAAMPLPQSAEWIGYVNEITDLVISDDASYISLDNKGGILKFPGSRKEGRQYLDNPKIYTAKDGLPSLSITSLAKDSDKMWIAYGGRNEESGLGLYDLNTGKWDTVFCSTLKDNPPFSDGQPYSLYSLWRVTPNKLFFYTSYFDRKGLWKLNTDNHDLEYLGPVAIFLGDIIDSQNNRLMARSSSYIAEFDTDSEKVKVIYGDAYGLRREYAVQNLIPPDYDKEATDLKLFKGINLGMYILQEALDLSKGTIHNNKVWARFGPYKIFIIDKGKESEEAEIIDNNILDGKPVERFVSTPYGLIGIGEGTVGLIETENMGK